MDAVLAKFPVGGMATSIASFVDLSSTTGVIGAALAVVLVIALVKKATKLTLKVAVVVALILLLQQFGVLPA